MDNGFGIGVGAENVAAGAQLVAQLDEVINFAVIDNPDGFVFVSDRLVTGGKVDDAEAPHAQPGRALNVIAVVVRTAVGDHIAHSAHDRRIGYAAAFRAHHSGDAAHIGGESSGYKSLLV